MDQFVLTRKLDPELIFNQNKYKDCYFDEHGCKRWKLSDKNECHICDRHQYVAIFYNRDMMARNSPALTKIKDKQFKEFMKEQVNLT